MKNIAQIKASCDRETGQYYIPPRALAADGSMRVCEEVTVPAKGALYSWTEFNGVCYGIVDLECGSRVQVYLAEGPHEIGAAYFAAAGQEHAGSYRVRFQHA